MQQGIHHCIHTNKYRLQISHFPNKNTIQIIFHTKLSNYPVKTPLILLKDENVSEAMCKYRQLLIKAKSKSVTFLLAEKHQAAFKDVTAISEYTKEVSEALDYQFNYGVKYWTAELGSITINAVMDPHHSQVIINVIQKTPGVRVASAIISERKLTKKSSPLKGQYKRQELLPILFKSLTESKMLRVLWEQNALITNHSLLQKIPLRTQVTPKLRTYSQQQQFPGKIQLFKHIFLTQIIAHMIINQLGRDKEKIERERNGYIQPEYRDEELEELRNYGKRFFQFRDHPFKCKRKQRKKKQKRIAELDQEDDYQDDDEEEGQEIQEQSQEDSSCEQSEQKKDSQNKNKDKKLKDGLKKKTKLQKMGQKIKKIQGICNFTFISGRDKSKINKVRYCLHQLTRQTDQTQALIDFLRLIFIVYPKEELTQSRKYTDKNKKKVSYFMEQFKVKRHIHSNLKEYTRQSFFHKVLNIGLRVFKHPYELGYLRLPFSHLFWSIKLIYQQHKKTIFADKKKKTIFLYRGFELKRKEVKQIRKKIGGYLEIEGLLSTSLRQYFASAFTVNAKMIIEIPVQNLKGIFDHGFAHISKFSEHPSEREVLVNAFNVFKILSLSSQIDQSTDMIVHTVRLEYGSIKSIEEKVKKSQKLLDAEYMWRINQNQWLEAKQTLAMNKENMTKKMYQKLVVLLPRAQGQLKRRKQKLEEREKEEYEHTLSKLSKWEKQLIINAKHQQESIFCIESYGDLLFDLGEYRRASIYFERRVKQIDLNRAIEGINWRKCECLIQKQQNYRRKLIFCLYGAGKPASCLSHSQKLLDVYNSTNVEQKNKKYYLLLYQMSVACDEILGQEQKGKLYKNKLMDILKKHSLHQTLLYKKLQEEQEYNKQKVQQSTSQKEKKSAQSGKKIKELKEQLENMKLSTYGKYTARYLHGLSLLIFQLYLSDKQLEVLQEGKNYLHIRRKIPHLEHRIFTCEVFHSLIQVYCKTKTSQKSLFQMLCGQISSFIHSNIHSYREFSLGYFCLQECLRREWWRASKPILQTLISIKVQCKLKLNFVYQAVLFGYALLLLSVSEESMVEKFLQWVQTLYRSQQYTDTKDYKAMISYIMEYNDKYRKSSKKVFDERNKDYEDNGVVVYVQKLIKNGKGKWWSFLWEPKIGEIIPFQNPFHQHNRSNRYLFKGLDEYLCRGRLQMVWGYLKQYTNITCQILDKKKTSSYLRRVNTFAKLHLNKSYLNNLLSLLEFWPFQNQELEAMQMWVIGIDLKAVLRNTQHLRKDHKQPFIIVIGKKKEKIFGQSRRNHENHPQLKRMKNIYARYKHYLLFNSTRQLRTRKQKIN